MAKKTNIAFAVAALIVIGLFFLVFFNIASGNRNLLLRQKNKAIEFSEAILSSIDSYMKAGDQEAIQPEFENLKNQKKVLEVSLANRKGELKRSSDSGLLNRKLRRRNIDDALEGRDSMMLILEGAYPVKSLVVTRSIKNRKDCFKCHNEKIAVLGVLEAVFDWTSAEKEMKESRKKTVLFSLLGFAGIIIVAVLYLKNFVS